MARGFLGLDRRPGSETLALMREPPCRTTLEGRRPHEKEPAMSRSTDRWEDASPFAWIFGAALAFVALGGIARAVMGRRPQTPVTGGLDGSGEDDTLAGHPS